MYTGKVVLGKPCLEILSMITVDFNLSETRTSRAHCIPMSQLTKAFDSVLMRLLVTETFYLSTGLPCPSPRGKQRVRIVLPSFLLGEILTSKLKD